MLKQSNLNLDTIFAGNLSVFAWSTKTAPNSFQSKTIATLNSGVSIITCCLILVTDKGTDTTREKKNLIAVVLLYQQ